MASDAELITASLAGDGEAFVEVIRRHEVAVGAYLVRRAGREIAEDLTVADAARALGIPAGTARRCLHQARQALRNAPGVAALMNDLNTVKETT